jgi:hypothetical protein
MTLGFPLLRLQPPTATMFTKQFRREAICEGPHRPAIDSQTTSITSLTLHLRCIPLAPTMELILHKNDLRDCDKTLICHRPVSDVHLGRPESTEWKSKNAVCGRDPFHQFGLDSVTASKLQNGPCLFCNFRNGLERWSGWRVCGFDISHFKAWGKAEVRTTLAMCAAGAGAITVRSAAEGIKH